MTTPALWSHPPQTYEVSFSPGSKRQEELKPEFTRLLHQTFIDDPGYDREYLPEFLSSDIYIRVLEPGGLAGIFTADLVRSQGHPVLHLTTGFVTPGSRSGGQVMAMGMALALDLAAQAFGSDHFHTGLRTANPRVVARLWQCPWVRFYPSRDWSQGDELTAGLRPSFCAHAFGNDRCDLEGVVFHEIYPTPPWRGQTPWHHDPAVNAFIRDHLAPHGRDAFLFLGPTLPPFPGMPRGMVPWPLGER